MRWSVAAKVGTMLATINRFLVVVDRQCNGVALTGALVLNPLSIWGGRNLDYRKRYKILMDKTMYSSALGGDPSRVYRHVYMKFRRPLTIEYNGNVNGDVTDIASNSLYFMALCDNAVNSPQLDKFWYRIRYTDV